MQHILPSHSRYTSAPFAQPLHTLISHLIYFSFSLCLSLFLFVFATSHFLYMLIRYIYFIGTRHAAVPALRFPLGHGGTARPSRRDALRAGTPLWPVPVSLPVHQGASAVQTPRQVQVLQYSALGDGIWALWLLKNIPFIIKIEMLTVYAYLYVHIVNCFAILSMLIESLNATKWIYLHPQVERIFRVLSEFIPTKLKNIVEF